MSVKQRQHENIWEINIKYKSLWKWILAHWSFIKKMFNSNNISLINVCRVNLQQPVWLFFSTLKHFFFLAVTTRTPWSRLVEHKKMPAVARSNSHRLLRHLRLPPRPLTPHRRHPHIIRPRPRPPLLHRTLPTSRERWPAAASRRGAGGRRYARYYKKKKKERRRNTDFFKFCF